MRLTYSASALALGTVIISLAGCGGGSFGASAPTDPEEGGGTEVEAGTTTGDSGTTSDSSTTSDTGANAPDMSVVMTSDSGADGDGPAMPVNDSGVVTTDAFAPDGAPDPTCDPAEQPAGGVFVSSTVVTSGDGSAALPLKTIAEGLALASAAQKTTVYLDQGTYSEQLKMTAQHSGITVQGGFRRVGAAWERDCSSTAPLKAVIASPTNVGASVTSLSKRSVLRQLSVFSKVTGDSIADLAGQSCYGVIVTGEGTALALEDVIIKAGTGATGGTSTAMVAGAAAACGDGFSSCVDGANGAAGTAAAMAASGAFAADGYAPGNGLPGQPGLPGHNGTVGAVGESATCYNPGCSGGGALCSLGLFCGDYGTSFVAAGKATCGCGGKAGNGGGAGHGGGASIGIYAAAKSTVVLTRVQVQTAAGGNGSTGGLGTSGIVGTAGKVGMDATCPGSCASVAHGLNCNCEQPGTKTLKGGTAGGAGGTGGKGSDGSGGAGGPSIGIVRQGSAIITRDAATTIMLGAAGKGANAPDGETKDEQVAP